MCTVVVCRALLYKSGKKAFFQHNSSLMKLNRDETRTVGNMHWEFTTKLWRANILAQILLAIRRILEDLMLQNPPHCLPRFLVCTPPLCLNPSLPGHARRWPRLADAQGHQRGAAEAARLAQHRGLCRRRRAARRRLEEVPSVGVWRRTVPN